MTNKQKKVLSAMVGALNRRITRGVAYLDKRFGRAKWLSRINESYLRLDDGSVCVTGQTFEDNWDGFFEESIKLLNKGKTLEDLEDYDCDHSTDKATRAEQKAYKYAAEMGFYLTDEDEDVRGYSWDILTRLWFARISVLKIENGIELNTPPPTDGND